MSIIHHRQPGRYGAAFPPLREIFALTLGCMATVAHAARPMVTDDARIVDGKACQLESWIKHTDESTEYWALPACNPSGNLELTLGGARMHENTGGTRTSDIVAQVKTLFKPLENNGWGIGLVVGANHHPQSVESGQDWYAYTPASFAFHNDRFLLHINVGWLSQQDTHSGRVTWGLGSETQLASRTWFIAEIFSQTESRPSYQIGLRHWLSPERLQLDMTWGDRLGGQADTQWFSVGLRFLTQPFLP